MFIHVQWLLLSSLVVFLLYRYQPFKWRQDFPANSPKLCSGNNTITGPWLFWTDRWKFFQLGIAGSKTGHFSFYLGRNRVVGLSGDKGREWFLKNKDLHLNQGYAMMDGPTSDQLEQGHSFERFLVTRTGSLLRGESILKTLPNLIKDTRTLLQEFGDQPWNSEHLFNLSHKWIYISTSQILAPREMIDDSDVRDIMIDFFGSFEDSASPTFIMFPWLPTPTAIKRWYTGFSVSMTMKKIVNGRKKSGIHHDDALDFMKSQGDSDRNIMQMTIALMNSAQFNSSFNTAWLLLELFLNPTWLALIRQEVLSVVLSSSTDASLPFLDRLATLTIQEWETKFTTIALCFRETIRIRTAGCIMRKNISGHNLQIGEEIIPNDTYVMYHIKDIHYDPTVYPRPEKWEPDRYLPGREEDQKKEFAYMGWGGGKHPCTGVRYAKLETAVLVAFFVTMFDYEIVYADGSVLTESPGVNPKDTSMRPSEIPLYFKVRPGKLATQ